MGGDFWANVGSPTVILGAAPLVAALCVWLASRLSPSARLTRSLEKNQQIWDKLPAGHTKDRLSALIDADAQQLVRRAESWRADPYLVIGGNLFLPGAGLLIASLVIYLAALGVRGPLPPGLDDTTLLAVIVGGISTLFTGGVILLGLGVALIAPTVGWRLVLAVVRRARRRRD